MGFGREWPPLPSFGVWGFLGSEFGQKREDTARNVSTDVSQCSRACCSIRRAQSLNCPQRCEQELIELLSWVRDRWWLRLSPKDDAHNESSMDPQACLELAVRRQIAPWSVRIEPCESHECARCCGGQWPSWLPGETLPSKQRDRALRQTVRVELDGNRAHIPVEMARIRVSW